MMKQVNFSETFTESWSMEWIPEETPQQRSSGQEKAVNSWDFSLHHNGWESCWPSVEEDRAVPHKEELFCVP